MDKCPECECYLIDLDGDGYVCSSCEWDNVRDKVDALVFDNAGNAQVLIYQNNTDRPVTVKLTNSDPISDPISTIFLGKNGKAVIGRFPFFAGTNMRITVAPGDNICGITDVGIDRSVVDIECEVCGVAESLILCQAVRNSFKNINAVLHRPIEIDVRNKYAELKKKWHEIKDACYKDRDVTILDLIRITCAVWLCQSALVYVTVLGGWITFVIVSMWVCFGR